MAVKTCGSDKGGLLLMENKNIDAKKILASKIVIPVLIVFIIAAIWFIKNSQKSTGFVSDNPDFALIVTEEIDLEKLKSYGLPVIIDFGSDSCGPCQEMAPALEELNKELQGKAIIRFVDVWKYPELAQNYPINVIPTQVFFDKDGNPYSPSESLASEMNMYALNTTNEHVLTTHVGQLTKEELMNILKEMGLED